MDQLTALCSILDSITTVLQQGWIWNDKTHDMTLNIGNENYYE